jgi:hypothetical protein
MLTEVGLYTDAVAVLSWPGPDSAFRRRAERDATIARTLAELESRDASADSTAAERLGDEHDRAVASAVDSPADLAARAEDLRRAWPPAALVRSRRRWAVERAEAAEGRLQGFGVRRVLEIVWQSLPTTILYRLWQDEREPSPRPAAKVAAETRFFFAPDPAVAKLLTALALFDGRLAGTDCAALAARALRDDAAGAAVDRSAPPSLAKLDRIARGCGGERPQAEARLETALGGAIAAGALQSRRRSREQGLRLTEAIADLRYAASQPAPITEDRR